VICATCDTRPRDPGCGHRCRPCLLEARREANRRHRTRHRQTALASSKPWRAAHPDRYRGAQRRQRAADPERYRAYQSAYRSRHTARIKQRRRSHPDINRDQINAADRTRRAALTKQQRRERRRNSFLRERGLDQATFDALVDNQGGTCAVCQNPHTTAQPLHLDHDHRCCDQGHCCPACIRGLLCSRHNRALGLAGDDPAILLQLAQYLVDNPATAVLGPSPYRTGEAEDTNN
jgi:hypothetical protein